MSFVVATNGTASAISLLNQFQTSFTNGALTAPPTVLGSATLVPLAVTLGTSAGSDGVVGKGSGVTNNNWSLGYNAGTDGRGHLVFNNGSSANYPNLGAATTGLTFSGGFTIGGALGVTGTTSAASLGVSGSLTVNTSPWAVPSSSTFNAVALDVGAWWGTGDGNWAFKVDDDGGNTCLFRAWPTSGSHASHNMRGYNYNASTASNVLVFTANGDNSVSLTGLGLLTNSMTRVSYFMGTGNGTYSTGLGATPSFLLGNQSNAGTSGCNTYNWFGNSSTVSVNCSGSWSAVAWAN